MKKKIILIGGGGHCKVIVDAVLSSEEYEIVGILDKKLKNGEKVLGIPILGSDTMLQNIFNEGVKNAFISFGSIGDTSSREEIYAKIKKIGFKMPVIAHPKAVIARDVQFGEGTFVAASATINPGTEIGENAIINTSSSVDHDCKIGDFVHIAPGAVLSGGVEIGDKTHVGTGAHLIQYVKIGKKCLIGMGVTVRHDVKDGLRKLTSTFGNVHPKKSSDIYEKK